METTLYMYREPYFKPEPEVLKFLKDRFLLYAMQDENVSGMMSKSRTWTFALSQEDVTYLKLMGDIPLICKFNQDVLYIRSDDA